MRKSSEKVALIILIPMLIFTLIITLTSKSQISENTPKQTIKTFFTLKSENNIDGVSALLADTSSMNTLKNEIDNIESIKLLHAQEEKDRIIRSTYLKYNTEIDSENLKIYKVKYDVKYNLIDENYKNGIKDTWLFLIRKNNNNWLIDL